MLQPDQDLTTQITTALISTKKLPEPLHINDINTKMITTVKAYINHTNKCQRPTCTTYTTCGEATEWHNEKEISSNIVERICNAANTGRLREYLMKKYKWK
jgi:hypothetical protein